MNDANEITSKIYYMILFHLLLLKFVYSIVSVSIVVVMTISRFGHPFTLRVPRDIPAHDLRMMLLNGMRHLLKESAHQQVC